MKLKDKQLLSQRPVAELETELKTTLVELTQARLDQKTNKLKNLRELAAKRNKIAILKTFISAHYLKEQKL